MKRLDLALPVGLGVGAVAIFGAAMLEGVRLGFLFQPTALLVVFGGTIGAVVVTCGIDGFVSAMRSAGRLFYKSGDDLHAEVARIAWLARAAQHEGIRVLESHAESSDDPLIQRGLGLAADYATGPTVREALESVLDDEDAAGARDAATIEAAGGYAPTFGIVGAVLGLINVLRAIDEPGVLGFGIATAFVATIYGVGFANLVLFPVAARLRQRHAERMRQRELLADAIVGLASHEAPGAIARRAGTWRERM